MIILCQAADKLHTRDDQENQHGTDEETEILLHRLPAEHHSFSNGNTFGFHLRHLSLVTNDVIDA